MDVTVVFLIVKVILLVMVALVGAFLRPLGRQLVHLLVDRVPILVIRWRGLVVLLAAVPCRRHRRLAG